MLYATDATTTWAILRLSDANFALWEEFVSGQCRNKPDAPAVSTKGGKGKRKQMSLQEQLAQKREGDSRKCSQQEWTVTANAFQFIQALDAEEIHELVSGLVNQTLTLSGAR